MLKVPVRPTCWMRLLYPGAIWRGNAFESAVYLTFDDGPVPDVTPKVLEILRDANVKATFFCIGANVEKHPEIYRNIIQEGHLTGNHTQHHRNGFHTSNANYLNEVELCANSVKSRFFRPPYGRMKLSQYNSLKRNYQIVMWDVLSKDYDPQINAIQCRDHVLDHTRNGSVIVFHDSVKASNTMLPVLPEILSRLKSKFRFARLDELNGNQISI
jgi:peptidoglycan-N-acetylglucosamine deacetylase